jgi:hypothetical protein
MIIATGSTLGRAGMDIVAWLRSLGLGKYEAAFRENDIDETVLVDLTEVHLRERRSPMSTTWTSPAGGWR